MMKQVTFLLLLSMLLAASPLRAGGVYQEPDDFIKEVFNGSPPKPDVIWLDKALKEQVESILAHAYKGLRIRYWASDDKTAWILEEIGKEKPITTGFVIQKGQIQRVKVLVFRESRGWEVRHKFFTDQFNEAKLVTDHQLDTSIDNISGATLSVRAVTKLARIALLLDRHVTTKQTSTS
jgi:hypothetical protein